MFSILGLQPFSVVTTPVGVGYPQPLVNDLRSQRNRGHLPKISHKEVKSPPGRPDSRVTSVVV